MVRMRKPANSRLRGGHGSGNRFEDFLPDLKTYLETEDEDGFMAYYESIPVEGDPTDEELKVLSDEMRGYFRELLAEKKRKSRRWN